MSVSQSFRVRLTTQGMQWMLVIASGLVFIVGIQLYILTEYTEHFFAWTIQSPLTAAVLGGSYWASCAMEFLASRKRIWAHARIAVPAVLIFTTLTLIVTLLHLDRFHLSDPDPLARTAAWAWLAVYVVVPLVMAALLFIQRRVPGDDPPRQAPLPNWIRVALLIHAAMMLPIGLACLLAPQSVMPLWPWVLTPLTTRALGAWLFALGVAAIHACWENDWRRVQIATLTYVLYAVLQLLALVRYGQEVAWSQPAAWLYVVFMLSVLVIGLYGWWESTRVAQMHERSPSSAAVR